MIRVAFLLAYPWGETNALALELWPGHGCRNAAEAHAFLVRRLAAGEYMTVVDADREVWGFHAETVRALMTADAAPTSPRL